MTDMSQRNSYWLTLGTLATTLFEITGYHRDVAAGHFIARGQMAVGGVAVLLGTLTIGATVAAAMRRPVADLRPPATYPGQMVVNASTAAFLLGMLAYLTIYPPTPWVFDTVLALAFPFGIMLMLPVRDADAPAVVAALNGSAGLAACAGGFAGRSGVLVMAGVLIGGAGWIAAIVLRRTMTGSLLRAVFSAFAEATRS